LNLKRIALPLASAFVGTLAALAITEIALRFADPWIASASVKRHRPCAPCSYVYEHIPGSPEINSYGLRGPEFQLQPDPATKRILLVGDSVTYGVWMPYTDTFGAVLSRQLEGKGRYEVINAGVSGFSTYNEARFLRDRLLPLQPGIVVLQLCLNDLADPHYHLNAFSRLNLQIPEDAVPNLDAALRYAASPAVRLGRLSWLKWSALFRLFSEAVLYREAGWVSRNVGVQMAGDFWPTFITAEMPLDLSPLLDYGSTEWQWLRQQLLLARDTAAASGARFILLTVPLAYQTLPGYPFHPEQQFERFCHENSIECVDTLAGLKGYKPRETFVLTPKEGSTKPPDVWHLTAKGHEVVGQMLADYISNLPPGAIGLGTRSGN